MFFFVSEKEKQLWPYRIMSGLMNPERDKFSQCRKNESPHMTLAACIASLPSSCVICAFCHDRLTGLK